MQFLIGLILILFVLDFIAEVVLPFLEKVLAVGLLGAAITCLGMLTAMGIHAINRQMFWAAAARGELTRDWLNLSHDSMQLKVSLNADRIRGQRGTGLIWLPAAGATIVILLLSHLVWDERGQGWSVFMLLSAGVFMLLTFGIWPHLLSARRSLEKELKAWLKEMNKHVGLIELSKAIKKNGRLASALGITFEQDYVRPMADHVARNLPKLLNDPGEFQAVLSHAIDQARGDGIQLRKAAETFDAVKKTYSIAASSVNRAGQASMFVYLDELLAHMEAAKGHLHHGRWDDFDLYLAEICTDLKLLADNADQASEDGLGHDDIAAPSGFGYDGYSVLGVQPTASDDEILQVYRRLVSIYHPDKSIVSSDEQFKRIKGAFDEIRKVRGLS